MKKVVNISIDYRDKHDFIQKLNAIYELLIVDDQHTHSSHEMFYVMIPDIPKKEYPSGPIPSKLNRDDSKH